jgi:hypothetical protein
MQHGTLRDPGATQRIPLAARPAACSECSDVWAGASFP